MTASTFELADAVASAREAWPEFELDAPRLSAFLAERMGDGSLYIVDLALAFGCLEGDAAALEAFRIEYGAVVRSGLARLGSTEEEAADLEQTIWERVLVGTPTKRPKVADYAGTGPLLHWLRVVLVRMRTDVLRHQARTPKTEGDAADLADRIDDPEFAYLKGHYRGLLKTAFAEAFEALEPRLKTALRLHLLDELSTEQIGRVHGVHAATARRWLANARGDLLEGTRIAIAREGVQASEFESIVRLVRSQLDLSLAGLLADG